MNTENIKKNIKEKIDDISQKALSIRERLSKEDNSSEELNKLALQLDKIQNELQEKFDTLDANPNADWDDFEKNIHVSMNSFNDAYKRAGTLFRG